MNFQVLWDIHDLRISICTFLTGQDLESLSRELGSFLTREDFDEFTWAQLVNGDLCVLNPPFLWCFHPYDITKQRVLHYYFPKMYGYYRVTLIPKDDQLWWKDLPLNVWLSILEADRPTDASISYSVQQRLDEIWEWFRQRPLDNANISNAERLNQLLPFQYWSSPLKDDVSRRSSLLGLLWIANAEGDQEF